MTIAQLASPSDLAGVDLELSVRLRWSYPLDITAEQVVFDVYGGLEATDALRTLLASNVAALEVEIPSAALAGTNFCTVVARRGDQLSLPAKLLEFAVRERSPGPAPPRAAGSASSSTPGSGLGFPFGITSTGSVFSQGGDTLLRSKVLQLLLTSPGERVNLPDYGTRLLDLVFDPNSDVLAATTQFFISRALQAYLGDEIRVGQVAITNSDSTLFVDISYTRREDAQPDQIRVGVPLPVPGGSA
jgi:Bacteriophage baseplate protein W